MSWSDLHVMVIEDHGFQRRIALRLLAELGVTHVLEGADGLSALEVLRKQATPPDVALLDLDLPGMDGLALARTLRAQGHVFPLLALTARSDADAEVQSRGAGFDGFLRKPVTGAMLAQALDGLMSKETGSE